MSDNHDAPHSDHDAVADGAVSGDAGSARMKWLGPLIALLFCGAILAGIGVANAASYDGELPHKDDHHGDEEHGDDDHGDEDDHSDDGDDDHE